MNTAFINPFKPVLELKRYPRRKGELLQAWDSADELMLQHLVTLELPGKRILIVNDSFGALSCALEGLDLTVYSDSFVSARATELNSGERIRPIHSLDSLQGLYDLVLLRLPKNLSFLEDILASLSHHLKPQAPLVAASMLKHLAPGAFDLLERYTGPTRTSLARKKARLIFAEFTRAPQKSPYPLQVPMDGFDRPFLNHSNLFSREKLDVGTRSFLEHLPQGDYRRILDLGCANGIIGIAAKRVNPSAKILFSDDSALAVESARANYGSHFSDEAEFHWTNCFEKGLPDSLDLVLCNPPFHQGTTLGDHIARQMFQDAHRCLRKGGLIRVIGNTHLDYPSLLRNTFGNAGTVATNRKFLIADARK